MKFINISFYAIILSATSTCAQVQIPEVMNVSGGTSKTKGYSLAWSIGELALINEMDAADSSYILTNGFIQPSDTLISAPVQQKLVELNNGQLKLSVADIRLFPNPTHDLLKVQFLKGMAGKISMQLYSDLGYIVYNHEFTVHGSGLIEEINMKAFTSGIYFLYIRKSDPSGMNDFQNSTFKIIRL